MQPEIRLSSDVFGALDALRDFMFAEVYLREDARGEHEKAVKLIRDLFGHFLEHPDEMPEEYHHAPGDLPTRVADYIAGMTDRYALRTYERLFLPRGWLLVTRSVAGGGASDKTTSTPSRNGPTSSKLVGQYLTLKKSGHDSLTGLCPFHQEKSPSFSVSPGQAGLLLLRLR